MYAYNPRKKTFQQLEKSLVGNDRWDILNDIMKELLLKKGEVPKQHWMIVGPRGIGKSHLLSLLYHKVKNDNKLKKLWLPVLFPEELRMAGDLAKFLERAANEVLIDFEREKNPIVNDLRPKIDKIKTVPIGERSDYIFSILSWLHESTGLFILFITENLQHLLGKKISVIEQKKLRAYLQTSDAVLLIGSATTIFEALHDHSNPFYHFFHIMRLEDLSFDDMKALIIDLLTEGGQHEVVKKVSENEARLRALYSFTGGNPRIAVFLADMLKTELPDEMISVMDKILDELTPYFEAILSDIPTYQEEVLNTLAAYEPAQSPKEIAEHLETPQPTIRNYIMQLKENGYVRVAFSKGKFNYYCLKEYLYRIWYQMRDSSHREETRWLMELLLMLYSPASIIEEKKKLEQCVSENDANLFYGSMISIAADFIERNPAYCKIIEWCVDTTSAEGKEKELLRKAISFENKKKYEKAIEICEEIIRINPVSEDAHILWGNSLQMLKRNDEAIEKFKKVMGLNSQSEHGLGFWGFCLMDQGKYEEAIEKFKKAIELKPSYYHAYFGWGDCLSSMERYNDAEQKYLKAIEINPKCEDVYLALGDSLIDQKRYDEAIEVYKRLLKVNPNSEGAYGYWGACLRKKKLYEEAIKKYQEVLKINPKSKSAYSAWASTLMEMKQYDKAVKIFEDHLMDSKNCLVNYRYGQCLFKLERYNEALNQFQKLIDLHLYCLMVYLDYGQALEKTGKKEDALIAYINHLRFSSVKSVIGLGFHETFKEYISPLLQTLKPEGYLKQFYLPAKGKNFSKPFLATLLLMLGKYDVVSEHLAEIINAADTKNEKEKQELDLIIFTIKLCIWVRLSEGNTQDALRLVELFAQYIKSLKTTEGKEKEVSNLVLSLFKLQVHKKIEADNIQKILKQIKDTDIPFNDVLTKVWVCLGEPGSVDAQKYLNEKAIAEVVRSIKEKEEQAVLGCVG